MVNRLGNNKQKNKAAMQGQSKFLICRHMMKMSPCAWARWGRSGVGWPCWTPLWERGRGRGRRGRSVARLGHTCPAVAYRSLQAYLELTLHFKSYEQKIWTSKLSATTHRNRKFIPLDFPRASWSAITNFAIRIWLLTIEALKTVGNTNAVPIKFTFLRLCFQHWRVILNSEYNVIPLPQRWASRIQNLTG